MLPGFRLLLATTVLAISILVFGLGAAALLRAAHEEFVSLPSWRLAQQPVLTPFTPQAPRPETTPILAMLRIEAPATKPLPETLRRDAFRPEATRQQPAVNLPVASLPVKIPPASTDIPDPKPAAIAAQDSGAVVKETEPASAAEQTATLNAQASIDAAASSGASTEIATAPVATAPIATAFVATVPVAKAPDVPTSASKIIEIKASNAAPAESNAAEIKSAALQSPEVRPVSRTASETEASEPISTETVASIERSSEATAFAIEPQPVVKKAKRPSARALARRRQIARARAEARAKAEQLRQQQNAFPLFGG